MVESTCLRTGLKIAVIKQVLETHQLIKCLDNIVQRRSVRTWSMPPDISDITFPTFRVAESSGGFNSSGCTSYNTCVYIHHAYSQLELTWVINSPFSMISLTLSLFQHPLSYLLFLLLPVQVLISCDKVSGTVLESWHKNNFYFKQNVPLYNAEHLINLPKISQNLLVLCIRTLFSFFRPSHQNVGRVTSLFNCVPSLPCS